MARARHSAARRSAKPPSSSHSSTGWSVTKSWRIGSSSRGEYRGWELRGSKGRTAMVAGWVGRYDARSAGARRDLIGKAWADFDTSNPAGAKTDRGIERAVIAFEIQNDRLEYRPGPTRAARTTKRLRNGTHYSETMPFAARMRELNADLRAAARTKSPSERESMLESAQTMLDFAKQAVNTHGQSLQIDRARATIARLRGHAPAKRSLGARAKAAGSAIASRSKQALRRLTHAASKAWS